MTPTETERSATVRLDGKEFHVRYRITGKCSYDPGKLSGPPEDCWPPESDVLVQALSILSVFSGDVAIDSLPSFQRFIYRELNKLPLDDYLLEDWMQRGEYE